MSVSCPTSAFRSRSDGPQAPAASRIANHRTSETGLCHGLRGCDPADRGVAVDLGRLPQGVVTSASSVKIEPPIGIGRYTSASPTSGTFTLTPELCGSVSDTEKCAELLIACRSRRLGVPSAAVLRLVARASIP